jgi:hypothetical protein
MFLIFVPDLLTEGVVLPVRSNLPGFQQHLKARITAQ